MKHKPANCIPARKHPRHHGTSPANERATIGLVKMTCNYKGSAEVPQLRIDERSLLVIAGVLADVIEDKQANSWNNNTSKAKQPTRPAVTD